MASVQERIAQTQERLAPLDSREQALRESLAQRRSLIADVLAALQRMGRQAPPARFVRPTRKAERHDLPWLRLGTRGRRLRKTAWAPHRAREGALGYKCSVCTGIKII